MCHRLVPQLLLTGRLPGFNTMPIPGCIRIPYLAQDGSLAPGLRTYSPPLILMDRGVVPESCKQTLAARTLPLLRTPKEGAIFSRNSLFSPDSQF
jgi:hypothetical protein